MAQLNIDFVLIDESVVMNGFRVLMSGAQIDQFRQNPIMLFMHNRAGDMQPVADNVMLAIGKWYDIRIDGNRLLAKPDFDDEDEFAMKVQRKVEKGYYNAASIWLDPIDISEDPALMLPGQIGPTVTKWGILEASIVDVPNCRNALAIRTSAQHSIMLNGQWNLEPVSYLKIVKMQDMNKKILSKLGLTEQAQEQDVEQRIEELLLAKKKLQEIEEERKKIADELQQLKAHQLQQRIEQLVDGAIHAGKIAPGDREKFLKLANADFDTTKELIDSMKPFIPIDQLLQNHSQVAQHELAELCKLTGRELYMTGKLERLKQLDEAAFRLKYKEAFGKDFDKN
ncbi:MAG: hypothetical protein IRZ03_14390 [Acidobacterium ailaaui]|nr:hypothetical protein [Pseudacidobacterium ailaaui]